MKLVIDINDNEYMGIKGYPDNITSYPVTIHLYDAVRNGTPLQKGHGRIIDENAVWNNIPDIKNPLENHFTTYDFQRFLESAPTIIEADKGGHNDA